jgi:hypothetical protein
MDSEFLDRYMDTYPQGRGPEMQGTCYSEEAMKHESIGLSHPVQLPLVELFQATTNYSQPYMVECWLQIEDPLENAGNRCSKDYDLLSLISEFKCLLIPPLLWLSSTQLLNVNGISFGDIQYTKSEGC